MPPVRIDTIAGRSASEIKQLTDAVHHAARTALGAPARHPYQIVNEAQFLTGALQNASAKKRP